MQNVVNLAVYRFVSLSELPRLRHRIAVRCKELDLLGTVLLAEEGINAFVAGTAEAVEGFKRLLEEVLAMSDLSYKVSLSEANPFHRLLVKIKKEIISMGEPGIRPHERTGGRMEPIELREWIDSGRDFTLIDTRNAYEVEVGTFERAMHLEVDSFREFAKRSRELPEEIKQKPVVMFCTGGIRCEKASAFYLEQGFKEVYQLEGGILRYFEQCGGSHFQGNCFVFDWRMAVDPQLKPAPRSEDPERAFGRHLLEPGR